MITDIAFGRPASYLEADEDKYDFISNVASLFPVMCLTAVVPSLVRITEVGWINKLLAPSKSDRMGIGRIMGSVSFPLICLFPVLTLVESPVIRSRSGIHRAIRTEAICWPHLCAMVLTRIRLSVK